VSPVHLSGRTKLLFWVPLFLITIVFIGFRHEVGGDWENYLQWYDRVTQETFAWTLTGKDSGYLVVNWLAYRFGWGIYGVNVVCSSVLALSLGYFCSKQPLSSVAWLVSIPYFLIVVGMGYTRQSVALGLFFLALIVLQEKRIWVYGLILIVAATFHTSILLFLSLVLLWVDKDFAQKVKDRVLKNKTLSLLETIGIVILICAIVVLGIKNYLMFKSQISAYLFSDYWESKGGLVRALMNVGPALCLIIGKRAWEKVFGKYRIWYGMSWLAILVLLATFFSTTFADRIGLYLLPLQLYFFSRVPLLFSDRTVRSWVIVSICALYGLILWVWLEHADHAYYWVPYNNVLFH